MSDSISEATRRVLSGEPLPIEADPPEWLGVDAWAMRQPTDWEYDDAQMHYEAARAHALADDTLQRVKALPVSDDYMEQQKRLRDEVEVTIERLQAKRNRAAQEAKRLGDGEEPGPYCGLTPEEAHELQTARETRPLIVLPTHWTRADEIAHRRAIKARNTYLMRQLIVDGDGQPLFQGEDGAERFERLDRSLKFTTLQVYLNTLLADISTAKNSNGVGEQSTGSTSPPTGEPGPSVPVPGN